MVLGKLPVPGRPTILITVGQGPTALVAGAGGGCLDIFTLIYPISILSPSLWETARYRLKYCLKGPLNPKQPTNQIQEVIKALAVEYPSPTAIEVKYMYIYCKDNWETKNNLFYTKEKVISLLEGPVYLLYKILYISIFRLLQRPVR